MIPFKVQSSDRIGAVSTGGTPQGKNIIKVVNK